MHEPETPSAPSTTTPARRGGRTALAALAVLTASGLALTAAFGGGDAAATTATAPPPVPATVARPVVTTVPLVRSYPATVEAIERVELRPRVAGTLDHVAVADGATVTRGQRLFQIDPRPYRAALAAAEAALDEALAAAASAETESLRASGLLTDRAVAVEEAERRATVAATAEARVAAARAAVERARLDLEFTEVRAPISGRFGRAEVTRGNLVGPETRLGVVVATDPLYVRFDVDEATLAAAAAPESWRIDLAVAGATLPAAVAFLDNEIGRGTGTLRLHARLDNSAGTLVSGMYGTAHLTYGELGAALVVREAAVLADQGERYVLALDDENTVVARRVTLGPRLGALRVVTAGLEPSDRVVVAGLHRLRPGTSVAAEETAMDPNATTSPATTTATAAPAATPAQEG
jgi:RND family efflux transporter MFP subunit